MALDGGQQKKKLRRESAVRPAARTARTAARIAMLGGAGVLALALGVVLPLTLLAREDSEAAFASTAASQASEPKIKPQRIVSLNPCIDAVLLHVADPKQILAVSHFSHDSDSSAFAAMARQFPATYETAEEVLMLKPDLVLASSHTSPATRRALEKMNIPLAMFGVPNSVDESIKQVRDIARAIGQTERGEQLAKRIEQALAAVPKRAEPIPTLILQSGGFSPGEGNLQDDLLRRAGMRNVAARYGVNFWGMVSLETLAADPPRLLLAGDPNAGTGQVRDRVLAHPVLRRFEGEMTLAYYPPTLLYCGGPSILEALSHLNKARAAVDRSTGGRSL